MNSSSGTFESKYRGSSPRTNSSIVQLGNEFAIRAKKKIKAGEELFAVYYDELTSKDVSDDLLPSQEYVNDEDVNDEDYHE